MAKTIRYARTSINGGLRQTTPMIDPGHVVPQETYRAPGQTGLEGLGAAMSNFFGLAQGAINNIQEGVTIGEKERIRQENEAQKQQAVSDFYGGKEMNKSLTGDLDYYNTYRSLLAVKTGDQASKDFQDYFLKEWAPANPTGDLGAARDEWVKKNISGSNDSDFEAQTLAQFYHSTDQMVSGQRETAVKNQIDQGKQTLNSAIDADVRGGTFTPDRIPFYIQSYKTLDPLNPYEAAPYVADQLANAAKLHPDKGMTVLNALTKPGTGVNDKSFAESFPDAYGKLQEQTVQNWASVKSMDQWNVIDGLRQRADTFKTMSDADMKTWLQDLTVATSKYGSPPIMDSMRTQLATEMERRATVGAGVTQVDQMLYQDLPKDESVIKKYLPDWLHAHGVDNILKGDPTVVSDALVRSGGAVPDDYRVQLSSALTSFENPKAQMAAAQVLLGVQGKRDLKFADGLLNDDASRYFHHIAAEQNLTDEPIEATIARANGIRRDKKELSWDNVIKVGSGEKVSDKLDAAVNDSVAKAAKATSWIPFWGTSITVPPDVRQTISDYALSVVEERGSQGVNWQTAVDEAVSRMGQRAEVRPANGQYIFSLTTDHPTEWEAADGKMHSRPRLGLQEYNLTTGQPVNTVQVYESQLSALGNVHRELLPNGSTSGVSLGDNPYAKAVGAYSVLQDGHVVNYVPGEKIRITSGTHQEALDLPMGSSTMDVPDFKEITFPDDPRHEPALANLPEGFGFVPMPLANGKTSWVLSYRPNYGDQAGKSLDQRAKEFQQPSPTQWTPPNDPTFSPTEPGLGGAAPGDPLSQPPDMNVQSAKPAGPAAPVQEQKAPVTDQQSKQTAFDNMVAHIKEKHLPPAKEAQIIATLRMTLGIQNQ